MRFLVRNEGTAAVFLTEAGKLLRAGDYCRLNRIDSGTRSRTMGIRVYEGEEADALEQQLLSSAPPPSPVVKPPAKSVWDEDEETVPPKGDPVVAKGESDKGSKSDKGKGSKSDKGKAKGDDALEADHKGSDSAKG